MSSDCLSSFNEASLTARNYHRLLHSSPILSENANLTLTAQKYANYLVENDSVFESKTKGLGENLYYSWVNSAESLSLTDCSGKYKY